MPRIIGLNGEGGLIGVAFFRGLIGELSKTSKEDRKVNAGVLKISIDLAYIVSLNSTDAINVKPFRELLLRGRAGLIGRYSFENLASI